MMVVAGVEWKRLTVSVLHKVFRVRFPGTLFISSYLSMDSIRRQ